MVVVTGHLVKMSWPVDTTGLAPLTQVALMVRLPHARPAVVSVGLLGRNLAQWDPFGLRRFSFSVRPESPRQSWWESDHPGERNRLLKRTNYHDRRPIKKI
jgi:hypothetical protein